MKNLIEVSVDSIRIHMPTAQHLVILKEKEADRYLPIWIGSFEAQAIATKISGNTLGRPLTHDLMATAFGDLGISVKRIVVTRLADQVFYARLYVKQNGRDLDFDARPSDAIALAVRVECPIFVAKRYGHRGGDPRGRRDRRRQGQGGDGPSTRSVSPSSATSSTASTCRSFPTSPVPRMSQAPRTDPGGGPAGARARRSPAVPTASSISLCAFSSPC